MNATLKISDSELSAMADAVERQVEDAKPRVQEAMAEMFRDIVISNLGPIGKDRPITWAPLSDRSAIGRAYIRKVGRTYATLYETGLLASSVEIDANDFDKAVVRVNETVCLYAARHQEGDPENHLPARPFFPISPDGEVTEFTTGSVVDAARAALLEALN